MHLIMRSFATACNDTVNVFFKSISKLFFKLILKIKNKNVCNLKKINLTMEKVYNALFISGLLFSIQKKPKVTFENVFFRINKKKHM